MNTSTCNKKNLILLFIALPFIFSCIPQEKTSEIKGLNTSDEVLHNGIILDKDWPPRYPEAEMPTAMVVPYLETPPEEIPINVGRQLFVDDFLIDFNSLERVFHKPTPILQNPVLEPDKPWEEHSSGAPYAAPFSDGVWFDNEFNKFRMWYLTGGGDNSPESRAFVTAYAESDDGINWQKPELEVVPGTNIVSLSPRDSSTVWLDRNELDKSKRYKFFNVEFRRENERTVQWYMVLRYSGDGLSWSEPAARSGQIGDRSTVYFDPFRQKWIYSLRGFTFGQRRRQYLESEDPELGVSLAHRLYDGVYDKYIYHWFNAWPHDTPHPDFPELTPAIYNHNAVAYESVMLGYFDVWNGPPNSVARDLGIQKRNRTMIGFSRDGFHWTRPESLPFIGDNPIDGAWNWGNVQSVAGGPLIVGDKLYFYSRAARKNDGFWDGYTSTGLFTMRRDGFASVRAGKLQGSLTTRPLTFDGSHLFVNADVRGDLVIEILDAQGVPIPGFRSKLISGNKTKKLVEWESDKTLLSLAQQKIRIRFSLIEGDLYSFWISPWASGESRGSLAAGGPGLNPSGWDKPISE